MPEFDRFAANYSDTVNRSIEFAGQDHSFFLETKAALVFELIERHLGHPGHVRALDIGCGVGALDKLLAERLGRLEGVDVSAESVRMAGQAVPTGHFCPYDGATLPYPDGCFDFVLTVCVLHHVPPQRWPGFVTEMTRVLRPGGLAAIIEHNPYNPLTRVVVNRCPFDAGAVLLSAAEVRGLFAELHLRLVENRYFTFLPFRRSIVRAIERRIGWLPLGAQYCVAAVKR